MSLQRILGIGLIFLGSLTYAMDQMIVSEYMALGSDNEPVLLSAAFVNQSQWIQERISENSLLGVSDNHPIVFPMFSGGFLEEIDMLVQDFQKIETLKAFIWKHLKKRTIYEIAELMKAVKGLGLGSVAEVLEAEFLKKLRKDHLKDFLNNDKFIDTFEFSKQEGLERSLAEQILTPKEVNMIRTHLWTDLKSGDPTHICMNPTSEYLALCESDDNACEIWSTQSGRPGLSCITNQPIIESFFCGGFIALRTKNSIQLWDPLASGSRKLKTLMKGDNLNFRALNRDASVPLKIWGMVASSDSNLLAVGAGSMICLYDLKKGKPTYLQSSKNSEVDLGNGYQLIFADNNSVIVEMRDNGVIRLWHVKIGECSDPLDEHKSPIVVCQMSNDAILSTISENGVLCRYNCEAAKTELKKTELKKRVLRNWKEKCAGKRGLAFNSTGLRLVLGHDDVGGSIFNLKSGDVIKGALKGCNYKLLDGCYHPDDERLALLTENKGILLWDTLNSGPICTLRSDERPQKGLMFSGNGNFLVSKNEDGTVRLWHYTNDNIQRELNRGAGGLNQSLLLLAVAQSSAGQPQVGTSKLVQMEHMWSLIEQLPEEIIRLLFMNDVDVNAKDEKGRTVLHRAAISDHPKLVQLLLDRGADVNQPGGSLGSTALHDAIYKGSVATALVLLENNADIQATASNGWTPLHCASYSGNTRLVDLLIKKGANVEAQAILWATPLHVAIFYGKVEVVEQLISKYDVQIHKRVKSSTGVTMTSLAIAAANGSIEALGLLLNRGADINESIETGIMPLLFPFDTGDIIKFLREVIFEVIAEDAPDGTTALHFAADCGNVEAVKWLIDHGANRQAQDKQGYMPIHRAVFNGHVDAVKCLGNVDDGNQFGITPLHLAVLAGKKEVVAVLLKGGANVDAECAKPLLIPPYAYQKSSMKEAYTNLKAIHDIKSKNLGLLKEGISKIPPEGRPVLESFEVLVTKENLELMRGATPLNFAAHFGRADIVKLLIKGGANMNAKTAGGMTILGSSLDSNNSDLIRYLIDEGADPLEKIINGSTLLQVAVPMCSVEIIDLLLKAGINAHEENADGVTALPLAIVFGRSDVLALFIKRGVDLNVKPENGFTLLHSASRIGNCEIVKLLIGQKADVNAKDCNGRTPLHEACAEGHLECIKFLITCGANVNAIDNEGLQPFYCALFEGHIECAQLLKAGRAKNDGPYLQKAAKEGNAGALQLLLELGGNPNFVDPNRWTLLHFAASRGHFDCVKLLVDSGANVNAVNKEGLQPFYCALFEGHIECAQLLKAGRAKNDKSYLRKAAEEGNSVALQLLLELGGNPNFGDHNNWTPLHFAASRGHFDCVKLLVGGGANVHARTSTRKQIPVNVASNEQIKQFLRESMK